MVPCSLIERPLLILEDGDGRFSLATFYQNLRWNNLIPGIALWKQNLATHALVVAVTFDILSLWSYVFWEMVVPLLEIVLKIFPRVPPSNVMLHWMLGMSAILCPFGASSISERAKNRKGLSQMNMRTWWNIHLLKISCLYFITFYHRSLPSTPKYSIVKPLFKKGDKMYVPSYRPISILTSFSRKSLEKVIHNRLPEQVLRNNWWGQ